MERPLRALVGGREDTAADPASTKGTGPGRLGLPELAALGVGAIGAAALARRARRVRQLQRLAADEGGTVPAPSGRHHRHRRPLGPLRRDSRRASPRDGQLRPGSCPGSGGCVHPEGEDPDHLRRCGRGRLLDRRPAATGARRVHDLRGRQRLARRAPTRSPYPIASATHAPYRPTGRRRRQRHLADPPRPGGLPPTDGRSGRRAVASRPSGPGVLVVGGHGPGHRRPERRRPRRCACTEGDGRRSSSPVTPASLSPLVGARRVGGAHPVAGTGQRRGRAGRSPRRLHPSPGSHRAAPPHDRRNRRADQPARRHPGPVADDRRRSPRIPPRPDARRIRGGEQPPGG